MTHRRACLLLLGLLGCKAPPSSTSSESGCLEEYSQCQRAGQCCSTTTAGARMACNGTGFCQATKGTCSPDAFRCSEDSDCCAQRCTEGRCAAAALKVAPPMPRAEAQRDEGMVQWEDASGLHFANRRAEVPAAYRARARPVDSDISVVERTHLGAGAATPPAPRAPSAATPTMGWKAPAPSQVPNVGPGDCNYYGVYGLCPPRGRYTRHVTIDEVSRSLDDVSVHEGKSVDDVTVP